MRTRATRHASGAIWSAHLLKSVLTQLLLQYFWYLCWNLTISELPEDLKNAFILAALEDRPQAETAELLGILLKAVGMRVYRARKLLLEKMSKMGF
jgi:hypothetical protein